RMRDLGIRDYQAYYDHVTQGSSGALEWSALVECLTVRETSFMRHRASFDCVARMLRERLQQPLKRPLQLWSVGCASGEEAYSLAMVVEQALREVSEQQ